jgi:RHS repeat-associated protein
VACWLTKAEYGYRNGQLLVTADAPPPPLVNVALASNGGVASVSSSWGSCCTAASINDGDRKTAGWNDATGGSFPDWAEVDFNGSKTISEIDVFMLQDNWSNPSNPTEAMTFGSYGLAAFDVQYWNGSTWATVPSGSVTGNNKVWRRFSFSSITTSKIKVVANASADGWSRLVEVEAWTGPSPSNVALAANGGVASVSSSWGPCCGAETLNNGDRRTSGWNDAAPANTFSDWAEVDFNGNKTIGEIDVFTCQDNWSNPSDPTETLTFSLYGLTGYEAQYWNGSNWVDVPSGSVSGNNKVWRKFSFSPITTTKVRVLTNASVDGFSRLTEVEAWSAPLPPTAQIHWLVTDQLGTPRMIFDQSGSLTVTDQNGNYVSGMTRHDYLPFGEELFAGTSGRTAAQGYSASDGVRQHFTQKERDNETGLDYFINRYYSSATGRFSSADPVPMTTQRPPDPQRLNLFAYVRNNPLVATDPNGLELDVFGEDRFVYIASLERSTGLKLQLDKHGVVSIVSKPKSLSKDAQKIAGIIESRSAGDLVKITAVENRADVLGGAFHGSGEQTIDMGDLRTEDKAGPGGFTVDSSVMHETIEAIEGRGSPCAEKNTVSPSFLGFHSTAIDAENEVRKAQGLAPRTNKGEDRSTKDSNGNTVVTFDFTTHVEVLTLEGVSGKILKAEVRKKQ